MESPAHTRVAPASCSTSSIDVPIRNSGCCEPLEHPRHTFGERSIHLALALWRGFRQCLPMIGAAFCFALLGLIVKEASAHYDSYELVFYRSVACTLWAWAESRLLGHTLRTSVPMGHAVRGITGAAALILWFTALGGLPLGTAVTLNLTSSVWMAAFAFCSAVLFGRGKIQLQLIGAVLCGFGGIALILQPSIGRGQLWFGAAGLASGLMTAMACLTISALSRAGEPVSRIYFYSAVAPAIAGAALAVMGNGFHAHTARGLAELVAIGLASSTAQALMTRAYCVGAPLPDAALQYLSIVFSFCASVSVFGEPVSFSVISGTLLVAGAGFAAHELFRAPAASRVGSTGPWRRASA